jgi:hypothetical protein
MKMHSWGTFAAVMGLAMVGNSIAGAQAPAAGTPTSNTKSASEKVLPANGPWIGTWKRQSTGPAAGNAVMKMWVEGDGFRYEIDMGGAHMTAFGRFDGKQYPEKGNAAADFNVFKRVDDHTYTLDDVKDSKVTHHFTVTISADGKTRTSVHVAKNEKGEEVTSTGVWDRVK